MHKPVLPPFHLRVVMRGTADVAGIDAVFGKAAAASLKELTLLRKVIGNESHRHAGVCSQGTHCQTSSREDGFRIVDMLLRQHRQGLGGRFHLDGMHVNLQLRLAQFRLRTLFGFMTNSSAAGEIHEARDRLECYRRHEDDRQSATDIFTFNIIG